MHACMFTSTDAHLYNVRRQPAFVTFALLVIIFRVLIALLRILQCGRRSHREFAIFLKLGFVSFLFEIIHFLFAICNLTDYFSR